MWEGMRVIRQRLKERGTMFSDLPDASFRVTEHLNILQTSPSKCQAVSDLGTSCSSARGVMDLHL